MVRARRVLSAILLIVAGTTAAQSADGVANIRYDLSIAGLPIGSASLAALIRNNSYRVDVAARIGGLLSLLSDGRGAASANGRLDGDKPRMASYALSSQNSTKRTRVQMTMAGGSVRDLEIDPQPTPRPDRVPVTAADRRGVVDPVSALLMPVIGRGSVVTPDACSRNLPVFDGAQRYDITLSYSRTEQVAGGKGGYAGPAVVCSARYTPIAGHRQNKEQTRYMTENHDMEVWLAPIGDTRILAPYKIAVATPIGRLVIGASRFDASPTTMSADAN